MPTAVGGGLMPEPPVEEGLTIGGGESGGLEAEAGPVGLGLFDGEGVGAGGVSFDIL
jgi:hypothetical protein